jgi:hypothetical protein
MSNELVGIVGVFAFTLFLFVLRYFCLSIGRPRKSPANATTAREDHGLIGLAARNDAWLLWNDPDKQPDSRNPLGGYQKARHSKEGTL